MNASHIRAATFRVLIVGLFAFGALQAFAGLSGGIHTTLEDGSAVDKNIYENMEDVYLCGGPLPNAPPTAAGLPNGDYYFQVTDPAGKKLLSSDEIGCREFRVEDGLIVEVYPCTVMVGHGANAAEVDGGHGTGEDPYGGLTIELVPYSKTPNKGDVYKAWVTPVEHYTPGQGVFGFIPAWSKTDNYKVKKNGNGPVPGEPPSVTVRKFNDKNVNGVQDEGEEDIIGWLVDFTDPLGVTNPCYTPGPVQAVGDGTWTFVEEQPEGTLQTVSIADAATVSTYPSADPTVTVEVLGDENETHEVVYGNVGLGQITACKFYDRNANGVHDTGEPAVAGWKMVLEGTDVTGAAVGPIEQFTGEDGCTTFADLLPGTYTVTEVVPPEGNWVVIGDGSKTVTIESTVDGPVVGGTLAVAAFGNVCKSSVQFMTKGYWHNKNGLAELNEGDRDYANGLDPYDAPSSYFGDGDEPFDGQFAGGSPVEAVNGEAGEEIAPEGSWWAEVSHFLVDANAGGDPREQLAQQLLAFIFNVRHRLGGPDVIIVGPIGMPSSGGAIIQGAIAAWASTDATDQGEWATLLDGLNNSLVEYYCPDPGPVEY